MINEMKNTAVIEGLLSEVDLKEEDMNIKGQMTKVIRGDFKVHVEMPIERGGENVELEVPIRVFSMPTNRNGNPNAKYETFKNLITEGRSIAKVGMEEADAVRITACQVVMNEYWGRDDKFISLPAVDGSWCFINKISRSDMQYKANAEFQAIVDSMIMVADQTGVETGELLIKTINIGFGNRANLIPVKTANPSYVSAIESTFKKGDVVFIAAKLNFSTKTETRYEEVAIGDPIEKTRTIRVNDVVISGIRSEDDFTYDAEDVKAALADRATALEDMREKAKAKNAGAKNVDRPKTSQMNRSELGF